MSGNAKRRAREAEKRVERLHYKFITEYVKCLHKDTFDKAEELYRKTRQLYPHGVKDLTKTAEFMNVVTPDKAIPRYYVYRKTNETNTEMEMVLEIPLIPLPQATGSTAAQSSPAAPPAAEVLQPQSSPAVPPAAEVLLPLLLPEEAYEELLNELQKDPDLMQILNDLPIDVPPTASQPLQSCDVPNQELSNDLPHDDIDVFTHDNDSMYNDMWDGIMPDDITPLEKELWFIK